MKGIVQSVNCLECKHESLSSIDPRPELKKSDIMTCSFYPNAGGIETGDFLGLAVQPAKTHFQARDKIKK